MDSVFTRLNAININDHNRRKQVETDIEMHDNAERDQERRDAYVGVI